MHRVIRWYGHEVAELEMLNRCPVLRIHGFFAKIILMLSDRPGCYVWRVVQIVIRSIPQIPLCTCIRALGPQRLPPGDLLQVEKVHPVMACWTDDFLWSIYAEYR